MTEFLKTVARHYFDPLPQKADGTADYLRIADHLFVFPNRRAGLFFGQYLVELNGNKPLFSPQFITIGDLFALFSHQALADRTTLLFHLYKVYNDICRKHDSNYKPEPFDSFIFWGEMLLRDFDDIDRYLADAEEVFFNVRDLQEIEQRFEGYPDDVIKVIQSFWRNVNINRLDGQPAKTSFVQTWAVLNDVYQEFRKVLTAERIAYDGMRQRCVVESLLKGECDDELKRLPSKIVFVGITAIDEAERVLLKWLQRNGCVEFCWDYGDERLRDEKQHASYFYLQNTTEFPNALSDEEQRIGVVTDAERKMTCIPVPSGVGQTTEAAEVLKQWGAKDALHTAVVLADENMLNPMLYAIPSEFSNFNVTMGYGLRSTSVFTLIEALVFLQKNVQMDVATKQISFYHKAVLPILGHLYVSEFEAEMAKQIRQRITSEALYLVPESVFDGSELLRAIFCQVNTIDEAEDYLNQLFNVLQSIFGDEDRYALDCESLIAYRKLLRQLSEQIRTSGIEQVSAFTLFHLLQKLAAGQSVSFSGEPLSGLQVMGVLETRALDFSRIVFLSMNEGIVPAKPSQNSFIPNTLRNAFGLPTQKHRDAIFAYHFYRLLSRAEEAVFIYDNRTEGLSTGEPSRYLLQMRYLSNDDPDKVITEVTPTLSATTEEPVEITVGKSEAIMKMLDSFKASGANNLSASNLNTYVKCSLQFFLSSVLKLYVTDDLQDEVDSSQFGTMFHNSMRDFYKPFIGKRVLADKLRDRMNDDTLMHSIVAQSYKNVYYIEPSTGYALLTCEMVIEYMREVIRHDMKLTPFVYLASEVSCRFPYKVNDTLSVNMRTIFDRVDIVTDNQGLSHLRIVDYKTGAMSNKLNVRSIGSIFTNPDSASDTARQVLFYCYMLPYLTDADRKHVGIVPQTDINSFNTVEPHLYFPRDFANQNSAHKSILTYVGKKDNEEPYTKQDISDINVFGNDFGKALNEMITELFDSSIPFRQAESTDACTFCKFTTICGRESDKNIY